MEQILESIKSALIAFYKSDLFLILAGALATIDLCVRLLALFRRPTKALGCNIIRLFEFPNSQRYSGAGIGISFRGQSVQNVICFFVLLRNTGNSDLRGVDFLNNIAIHIPSDIKILTCELFKVSRDVQAEVTHQQNCLSVKFDLLKPREKVAMRVFSTQPSFAMKLDHRRFTVDYRVPNAAPDAVEFGFPADPPFWALKSSIDPLNLLFAMLVSTSLFGNPMITGLIGSWVVCLVICTMFVFPALTLGVAYAFHRYMYKRKTSFYYEMELEYRKYN